MAAAARPAMAYFRSRIVRARHGRQDRERHVLRSSRLSPKMRSGRAPKPQLFYASTGPELDDPFFVMARLDPAIPVFLCCDTVRTWMPGTRPGMTVLVTWRFEV